MHHTTQAGTKCLFSTARLNWFSKMSQNVPKRGPRDLKSASTFKCPNNSQDQWRLLILFLHRAVDHTAICWFSLTRKKAQMVKCKWWWINSMTTLFQLFTNVYLHACMILNKLHTTRSFTTMVLYVTLSSGTWLC